MEKRTRTIIFIACIFLFAVATPSIILYSQGYRFDFDPPAGGKKIVQTGALYLKVAPRSAEVYLNGRLKTRTSMITGSTLIENLLPKTYQVEVRKNGYIAWQKSLTIKESQAAEAKNIILFPENPNFTPFNRETKNIEEIVSDIEQNATSSDKNKVIEASDYEIGILFLEDKERVFLTRFSEKIGHIFWLTDYYLIFSVGNKIKVAEIDNRDRINIIDLAEFANPEIFWSQKDKTLYVISKQGVELLENLLP